MPADSELRDAGDRVVANVRAIMSPPRAGARGRAALAGLAAAVVGGTVGGFALGREVTGLVRAAVAAEPARVASAPIERLAAAEVPQEVPPPISRMGDGRLPIRSYHAGRPRLAAMSGAAEPVRTERAEPAPARATPGVGGPVAGEALRLVEGGKRRRAVEGAGKRQRSD